MALRTLRSRIRTVRNTAQITKAMEVVSATKMRRSQEIALRGRPYALAALEILKNIAGRSPIAHPYFRQRANGSTLMVIITSDKGLAGAFNANVLRAATQWTTTHNATPAFVAVGKKAKEYIERRRGELTQSFTGFGDYIDRADTASLATFIYEAYRNSKRWKNVIVCYTNFRTTLKQETRIVEVLPLRANALQETIDGILPEHGRYADKNKNARPTRHAYEYRFEPSPAAVLRSLVPTLFAVQMHHIVLESNASEHSARMVAMKNASENARALIGELTLAYNKARQAAITKELAEMTAGQEAVA